MREQLFTLSHKQRDDLERRYKQTSERRISERIQAILLLDAGQNRQQVARILRVNPKTITRWVHIFVRSGIDTLCTLHSDHRRRAEPAQHFGLDRAAAGPRRKAARLSRRRAAAVQARGGRGVRRLAAGCHGDLRTRHAIIVVASRLRYRVTPQHVAILSAFNICLITSERVTWYPRSALA